LPQTYLEVVDIIKSYSNPAGLCLEIGMPYWGGCTEWQGKTTCRGKVSGWHNQDKGEHERLAVKWDGYDRNQKAELVAMEADEHGNSLGLKLLAFEDGTLPSKQLPPPAPPPPPPPQPQQQQAGARVQQPRAQQQEAAGGDEIDKHGRKWRRRSPTYVKEDAREKERHKPRLQAGGLSLHSMMSLFLFLLPPKWVEDILKYTNAHLDDSDTLNKKLTKGELLRFMGYMLILTLQNYLPIEKMWSKESPKGTTAPPPAMGQFGMSIGRFTKLKAVLRFGPEDTDSFQDNEYCFCEGLITAFNAHMNECIFPGWLLAPDESMFAWRGKVGKNDRHKCPKLQFVRRKPEPLGTEIKNIGCALSGLIIFMEIMKGKAELVKPKFWSRENGATAATTMRLSENWFGTGRVVAGDSWFASVRTAEQMLLNGLHFIGDIKTGTTGFPLKEIFEETDEENGSWATMTSSIDVEGDEKPIYGCSHRRGESIHAFVATCGTTLPGSAHLAYLEDDEEQAEAAEFELARKAARVHNDFTTAQPTIDRHNRYRQHILAMEKRFVTNNYSFRFFTSMLGTLFVNVFMAHRYFNDSKVDFRTELDKLGLALVTNVFVEPASPAKSPTTGKASPCDDDGCQHHLVSLRSFLGDKWKSGMQRRCTLCDKETTWVCATCSTDANNLFYLCPETTIPRKGALKGVTQHHMCLCKHRRMPSWVPPRAAKGCGKRRRKKAAAAEEEEGEEEEDEGEQFDE